jgi:hypothetical protein
VAAAAARAAATNSALPATLVGVAVHVDQLLARTRCLDHRVAAARRLIQARADHQQQVGLVHARGEPWIDPQAEHAAVHR